MQCSLQEESTGERPEEGKEVRCVPETGHFSWKGDRPLKLPYEECILYTTHVRGFTMDPSAKVRHPGTFAGIREKIPYLKGMGITQLELMPVYEFFEWSVGPPQKKHQPVPKGYLIKSITGDIHRHSTLHQRLHTVRLAIRCRELKSWYGTP